MNKNSKICCFIKEHPDWKEILETSYGIIVKAEDHYAIFNYGANCDFSDPIVQEARGIIINTDTLEVACFPFRKFGNYNESYADKIDWDTARVQEKIDGSIIKMWFDNGNRIFSTNSMIYADNVTANSMTGESFMDIIRKADNFQVIEKAHDILNKDCTYIFELVSPETQIVIRYDKPHLYHTGTRNNLTGEELMVNIGIEKPKEYPLKSLDDCINAAVKLNQSQDGEVHRVTGKGYVVVDGRWNRIKVKSPDYLMLHHLSTRANFSKERIVGLLRDKTIRVEDICEEFPDFSHYFKYYDFKMAELEHQAKAFCDLTKRIYEEYSHDRKAVAQIIKKHRLGALGFACLDSGKSGSEILAEMPTGKYCRYIPDYQPENLSDLFYRSSRQNL